MLIAIWMIVWKRWNHGNNDDDDDNDGDDDDDDDNDGDDDDNDDNDGNDDVICIQLTSMTWVVRSSS